MQRGFRHEDIELSRPTRELETDLGRFHAPELDGNATLPGLVFVHDVWGPSEHSRALAADLAAEGFGVLEINLYRNLGEFTIDAPGPFIRSLSDPAILADLDAGADWLAGGVCAGRRCGVIGVCMGGTYALLAACRSNRFSASAPFYGILDYDRGMLADPEARDRDKKPASPLEAAADLAMPLLASFGAEDTFVPVADVRRLESELAKGHAGFQVDLYDGAGHAFLNRTRAEAYRAQAAQAAWDRLIPFLSEALR